MKPRKSILDPTFRYTKASAHLDPNYLLRKFRKMQRQQGKADAQAKEIVRPIRKVTQ